MGVMEDKSGKSKQISAVFPEYLSSIPPGQEVLVGEIIYGQDPRGSANTYFMIPDVDLHCDQCEGVRSFEPAKNVIYYGFKEVNDYFFLYKCRNCRRYFKTYAVKFWNFHVTEKTVCSVKYGEIPFFGPPVSKKLSSILGSGRDYFFKGRRAENQGLGIAAFAYYRRVVEDQKDRIIDEIIKVCNVLHAGQVLIDELEAAKRETQFTTAVEQIKSGLPQILMIDSHNPLTVLHGALSKGLHALPDEECLKIAGHIRVIMAELAERLSIALKDTGELNEAVKELVALRKKEQ